MSKLIIIRGLPGSGKSTVAKKIVKTVQGLGEKSLHIEADMYFGDEENYAFDPKRLPDAHKWCQETVQGFLDMGYVVVVSNTFTKKWEIDPYLKMLPAHDILVLVATGKYKNVHNVPDEVIEKMQARWEPLVGERTLAEDGTDVIGV